MEEDITIKVSVQEDKLNLIYKGILMQEGRFQNAPVFFIFVVLLRWLTSTRARPAGGTQMDRLTGRSASRQAGRQAGNRLE